MNENRKTGDFLWKIVQAGLIVFTLLGFIKGIWISLDIDESYAVAQSYRLACGDRLLRDMWESHQFSAFLGAWFIQPYLLLFHTTDYLVIYLRVVGILIHTGLGIWLYCKLKADFGAKVRFLVLMLHLNFLPKWVQVPEFELMHYWFLLAIFLLLYSYFTKEKAGFWDPLLAGACLVGSMMSYPTMILLYPVYLIGICVLEKQKHNRQGRQCLRGGIWFTLGAATTGIGFLAYLFSYQTFEELKRNISYIFLDESHAMYSQAVKWIDYMREFGQNCLEYLIAILSVGVLFFLFSILFAKSDKMSLRDWYHKKTKETLILALLFLTAVGLQIGQIVGSIFLSQNQFFLQIRYIAVILPAIYLGIQYHKQMAVLFYLCILPAIFSIPAVLIITNMSLNVTYSRTFLGVIGSILMLSLYCKGKKIKYLQYLVGFGILVGLLVCRLVLIRVTGCLPATIKAPLEPIQEGPAKGIYILQQYAWIQNANYKVLKETVTPEDRLLYVGAENLIYVTMESTVATPSTQGTAVYNEMYLYYYEEHPERLPNVIVIDKTFEMNYDFYSPNNQIILDWIEENYADAEVTETGFLKILRKYE